MRFDVLLTADADLDLEQIYDCIAKRDTPGTAADVLDRIEETLEPSRAPLFICPTRDIGGCKLHTIKNVSSDSARSDRHGHDASQHL